MRFKVSRSSTKYDSAVLCERCGGEGEIPAIGAPLVCPDCNGSRFDPDDLYYFSGPPQPPIHGAFMVIEDQYSWWWEIDIEGDLMEWIGSIGEPVVVTPSNPPEIEVYDARRE